MKGKSRIRFKSVNFQDYQSRKSGCNGNIEVALQINIWGKGLLGVATSLAMRKSAGIILQFLHHKLLLVTNDKSVYFYKYL